MKNNNKGFSLVELIVVIAIMAILAAVAVAGFSFYIPKAQQASDKQMIADIEDILLYEGYAGAFEEGESGYIVLSTNGVVNDIEADSALDIALKNAYGADYKTTLKLAYDGWVNDASILSWMVGTHDDGSGNAVVNNTYDELVNIGNSSFLTGNTTGELMTNVENLTTKLAGIVDGMDVAGKQAVYEKFSVEGSDYNALQIVLESNGYSDVTEVDTTTLSNLVVLAAAEEMKGTNTEDTGNLSQMAQYVSLYSMYTAYAANDNSSQAYKDQYASLQTQIQQANDPYAIHDLLTSFNDNLGGNEDNNVQADAGWAAYEQADLSNDADAFAGIMNAVASADISKVDLQDANLFTQGSVNTVFNDYVAAVNMIGGMSETEYNALVESANNGGVTLLYSYVDGQMNITSSLVEMN